MWDSSWRPQEGSGGAGSALTSPTLPYRSFRNAWRTSIPIWTIRSEASHHHGRGRFLADRDKFAFQQWVCDQLGIDADIRKGADHGIDGEIVRYDIQGHVWRAVVSVKGGGVNVTQIRDLRGTVEREKADAGIFVTFKSPTRPMKQEAIAAGLDDDGIPKLQILTAADLIAGKAPEVPVPQMVAQRPVEAVRSQRTEPCQFTADRRRLVSACYLVWFCGSYGCAQVASAPDASGVGCRACPEAPPGGVGGVGWV